jgi:hypothetical protein
MRVLLRYHRVMIAAVCVGLLAACERRTGRTPSSEYDEFEALATSETLAAARLHSAATAWLASVDTGVFSDRTAYSYILQRAFASLADSVIVLRGWASDIWADGDSLLVSFHPVVPWLPATRVRLACRSPVADALPRHRLNDRFNDRDLIVAIGSPRLEADSDPRVFQLSGEATEGSFMADAAPGMSRMIGGKCVDIVDVRRPRGNPLLRSGR